MSTVKNKVKYKKAKYIIGPLLDAQAKKEIREFYAAIESSKNSKTMLPTWIPPVED